jgi:hypothetical protein
VPDEYLTGVKTSYCAASKRRTVCVQNVSLILAACSSDSKVCSILFLFPSSLPTLRPPSVLSSLAIPRSPVSFFRFLWPLMYNTGESDATKQPMPRIPFYCECRVADFFRDNRLSTGGQYAFNIGKHENSVDLTADKGRRSK